MIKKGLTSWKTTTLGVLIFVDAVVSNFIALLDANPDTVADWNVVVMAGTAMVALFVARDADKSSEDQQLA